MFSLLIGGKLITEIGTKQTKTWKHEKIEMVCVWMICNTWSYFFQEAKNPHSHLRRNLHKWCATNTESNYSHSERDMGGVSGGGVTLLLLRSILRVMSCTTRALTVQSHTALMLFTIFFTMYAIHTAHFVSSPYLTNGFSWHWHPVGGTPIRHN